MAIIMVLPMYLLYSVTSVPGSDRPLPLSPWRERDRVRGDLTRCKNVEGVFDSRHSIPIEPCTEDSSPQDLNAEDSLNE
jgi:hypothetical protein